MPTNPSPRLEPTRAATNTLVAGSCALFRAYAENGGSSDLLVDGSVTPVEFVVSSDATDDVVLTKLHLWGGAASIGLQKFLSIAALTNGLLITLKLDGVTIVMEPIKTARDIKHLFGLARWSLDSESSYHDVQADYNQETSMVLKKGSTDEVKIAVRDDLTGATLKQLEMFVTGHRRKV